jgi:hypothetical protein
VLEFEEGLKKLASLVEYFLVFVFLESLDDLYKIALIHPLQDGIAA